MTPEEVLSNLRNFELWDIQDYLMSKREAVVCIKALQMMCQNNERIKRLKGGER